MRPQSLTFVAFACAMISLIGCSPGPESVRSVSQQQPLVVFLVRHGERADSSRDSELSEAGRQRALVLARTLRDAGIGRVHSTDFVRTRDTAAPAAAAFGLQVQLYDPGNLQGLVENLRATGGRHLVVGHSDTTPLAVELLGGDPSSPIDEDGEYDRLYIIATGSDGEVISTLIRYGDLYAAER